MHWIALGLAAALVIHGLKIFDLTTLPGIGPLLAKFLTPHAKRKPVDPQTVQVDTLDPQDRCDALFASITALRHYASEQPKDKAVACLDACDVLWQAVGETHKTHATV
jgi:hypothetical protein